MSMKQICKKNSNPISRTKLKRKDVLKKIKRVDIKKILNEINSKDFLVFR